MHSIDLTSKESEQVSLHTLKSQVPSRTRAVSCTAGLLPRTVGLDARYRFSEGLVFTINKSSAFSPVPP